MMYGAGGGQSMSTLFYYSVAYQLLVEVLDQVKTELTFLSHNKF